MSCWRVALVAVRHRSYDRQSIRAVGQLRQVLTKSDIRQSGGNRLELTPKVIRSFGLGVKCIDMTGATGQEYNNYRLR